MNLVIITDRFFSPGRPIFESGIKCLKPVLFPRGAVFESGKNTGNRLRRTNEPKNDTDMYMNMHMLYFNIYIYIYIYVSECDTHGVSVICLGVYVRSKRNERECLDMCACDRP